MVQPLSLCILYHMKGIIANCYLWNKLHAVAENLVGTHIYLDDTGHRVSPHLESSTISNN